MKRNMAKEFVAVAVVLIAVLSSAAAVKAKSNRGSNSKDSAADQREAWIREVKKLEAEPVVDGFVKWTGLDGIRGSGLWRHVTPSDLRGRFVIVVEIDDTKPVVAQLRSMISVRHLDFCPDVGFDWNFTPVNRDVMVVYNLHNLSEADLAEVVKDERLMGYFSLEMCYFSNVTFEGAPDSESERPYVYVMGPEGKDPLYKGKMDPAKTAKDIRETIAEARTSLPEWHPWYGYVNRVKHFKGVETAIIGGKPFAPAIASLKKALESKNQEIAVEAQRLYDAIGRTKGDLLYRVKREWFEAPLAAKCDLEEVVKRFPAMKGELAPLLERLEKAHPNAGLICKHYALYRKYADPLFCPKSKAEVKKIVAELSKAKLAAATLADDKDVAIQNLAMTLPGHIDELIAELPTRIKEK